MSIIEKKIKIKLENGCLPDVNTIETAITRSGIKPVRWAIVDMDKNECTILANGVVK